MQLELIKALSVFGMFLVEEVHGQSFNKEAILKIIEDYPNQYQSLVTPEEKDKYWDKKSAISFVEGADERISGSGKFTQYHIEYAYEDSSQAKQLQDVLLDFMQKNVPAWSAYRTNSGLLFKFWRSAVEMELGFPANQNVMIIRFIRNSGFRADFLDAFNRVFNYAMKVQDKKEELSDDIGNIDYYKTSIVVERDQLEWGIRSTAGIDKFEEIEEFLSIYFTGFTHVKQKASAKYYKHTFKYSNGEVATIGYVYEGIALYATYVIQIPIKS